MIALSGECPATKPHPDLNGIKGTWKITSEKYDGKKLNNFIGGHLTFDGKFSVLKVKDKKVKDKYTLHPSKKPKWIDIIAERGDKTLTIVGIYSLDGDTLKLCHNDPGKPRPTEFVTKPGDQRSLVTLTRVKKKE